jgi:RNA polymerase sigma factor (sigma-70 family)
MARVYQVYVEHDDLLDIVGVGNLAITEKLDQALEKATESVTHYLCGVARWSIMRHCLYHSRLIDIKDHRTPLSEFPQTTSLEALSENENGDDQSYDPPTLVQPVPTHPQETDEQRLKTVRQALAQLTATQREMVEMHYGFNTYGATKIADIAAHLAIPQETAQKRHYRAIKRLRKWLPTKE